MPLTNLTFYFTAVACKKRWQSLRDAYRRAINKRKEKSAEGAKNIKPWKYENEMAFVTRFLLEKRKNYVEIISDEDSDNADDSQAENNTSEKPDTNNEDEETAASVSDSSSTSSLDEVPQKEPQKEPEINKTTKRNPVKRKLVQSASAVLMAKLLEEQNKEPPRGHDELDRFFLSISDTVKKFSPYVQAVLKNRIFSLVSEMELQQLAPSSSSTYVSNSSAQLESAGAPSSPEDLNEQIDQFDHKNTPKRTKK